MTSRKIYLPAAFAFILVFTIGFSRIAWDKPNDLYAPWFGTRALLLEGRNPYRADVTREIQQAFYGHELKADELRNEQRFAYPVYTIFLTWPLALLPLHAAEIVGLFLTVTACIVLALLSFRFLHWPLDWNQQLAAVFVVLSSGPALRTIRLQQLGTLVTLILIGSFLALRTNRHVFAGLLLALATVKPQFALLPIAWVILWCLYGWSERKKVCYSFLASIATLVLSSEIILPRWEIDFLHQLTAYRQYAGDNSFFTMLAGQPLGIIATAALLSVVGYLAWTNRKSVADMREFEVASVSILAVAALTMPTMAAAHNQLLMAPAAVLLFRELRSFGKFLKIALFSLPFWNPGTVLLTILRPDKGEVLRVVLGTMLPLLIVVAMMKLWAKSVAGSNVHQCY